MSARRGRGLGPVDASPPPPVEQRCAALGDAIAVARRHLGGRDGGLLDEATAVVDRSRERLGMGTHHTVVVLAGPTGAGKSTLYNWLCGAELSQTGVRRPTTGETHGCSWGEAGALLDWLRIRRRHEVAEADERLDGLVLLDLPDFDSTVAAHRDEVDRLVELADLFVWVVDPQKYADESFHHNYVAPLAAYGHLMRFVLTKRDLLGEDEARSCAADLRRRLVDDGIEAPEVLPVSVTSGLGLEDVIGEIRAVVAERAAMIARVEADLAAAARRLDPGEEAADRRAGRDERGPGALPERAAADLVAAVAEAVGVDAAAEVAAAQYRREANLATGWPPTRWIRRWRRAPIAAMSKPSASSVAEAKVDQALRAAADAASVGIDDAWRGSIRERCVGRRAELLASLEGVLGQSARVGARPAWWAAGAAVQGVALVCAAVGLVWLLIAAVGGGFLHLDTDPLLPMWRGAPIPTWLLAAGVALGLATAAVCAGVARAAGGGRRRRALALMRERVAGVVVSDIVAPLDAMAADRRELRRLLAVARGGS